MPKICEYPCSHIPHKRIFDILPNLMPNMSINVLVIFLKLLGNILAYQFRPFTRLNISSQYECYLNKAK